MEAHGAMLDPILGTPGPAPCHLPGTAFSLSLPLPNKVVLALLGPSPKGSQTNYFN